MAKRHISQAHFFIILFIPVSNAMFGYTKSQYVEMDEQLPKTVASQWQEWGNGTGYVKMKFNKTINTHYFDSVSFPFMWVNSVDDSISNNADIDDMLRVLPNIKAE